MKMWKRLIIGLIWAQCWLVVQSSADLGTDTVDEKRINLEANKSYKQVIAESKLSKDQRLVEMVSG